MAAASGVSALPSVVSVPGGAVSADLSEPAVSDSAGRVSVVDPGDVWGSPGGTAGDRPASPAAESEVVSEEASGFARVVAALIGCSRPGISLIRLIRGRVTARKLFDRACPAAGWGPDNRLAAWPVGYDPS